MTCVSCSAKSQAYGRNPQEGANVIGRRIVMQTRTMNHVVDATTPVDSTCPEIQARFHSHCRRFFLWKELSGTTTGFRCRDSETSLEGRDCRSVSYATKKTHGLSAVGEGVS
jgi:hypothetical protein